MSQDPLLSDSVGGSARTLPRAFVCSHTNGGLDAAWVHVAGELDIATTPRLESTLRELHSQALLVVLDLREVEFVDSSGVHAIVDASVRARRAARRLVVVRNPATVDRVFTLTESFHEVDIGDLHPAEPPVQVLLRLAAEDAVQLAITDTAGRTVVRTTPADLSIMLDECDIPGHDDARRPASRPVRAVRALAALLGLRMTDDQRSRRADWLGGPPLDEYTLSDGLPSEASREHA
jgi:anti-sigma B factor antagonist